MSGNVTNPGVSFRTKKGSVITPLHLDALTVIRKITVSFLLLLIMSEEAQVINHMMLI